MKLPLFLARALLCVAFLPLGFPAFADTEIKPVEADWIAKDFKFHTGEVMPEMRVHYTTIGAPTGEPVLVLHGTTGSGTGLLGPGFGGELFGPGQALDAAKYYVILPDSIGHGKSSKPSDGSRAKFPRYDYEDMVSAQYKLLTEHLGVKHLRMVLGNSMGGMETWIWGVRHPEFMDILVPMASQPVAMSARNWMMRRMLIDAVKNDPDYNGGDYTTQPKSLQTANAFFGIATSGGSQAYYKAAPTRAAADELLDKRLATPFKADANDTMYQWDSSRDFDPSGELGKIKAKVFAINSADDERNPPELGVMERELKRIPNAELLLIPASEETRGHGTTGMAKFWSKDVKALLESAPKSAN